MQNENLSVFWKYAEKQTSGMFTYLHVWEVEV